jgi:hypothetical protein
LCWNTVHRLRTRDAPEDPESIAELDEALGGVLAEMSFEYMSEVANADNAHHRRGEFLDWVDADIERWQAATRHAAENNALVGLYSTKFPVGNLVAKLQDRSVAEVRSEPSSISMPDWEAATYGFEQARMVPLPGSPENPTKLCDDEHVKAEMTADPPRPRLTSSKPRSCSGTIWLRCRPASRLSGCQKGSPLTMYR